METLLKNREVSTLTLKEAMWLFLAFSSQSVSRKIWKIEPSPEQTVSDHQGLNFSYNSQVLWRKHPVLGIKLNPLSLLFQLARYHRNNTNNWL